MSEFPILLLYRWVVTVKERGRRPIALRELAAADLAGALEMAERVWSTTAPLPEVVKVERLDQIWVR